MKKTASCIDMTNCQHYYVCFPFLKKMGHVVCDAVVKRVSVTKKPIFTTVRKTTTLGRVVFPCCMVQKPPTRQMSITPVGTCIKSNKFLGSYRAPKVDTKPCPSNQHCPPQLVASLNFNLFRTN